MFAKTTVATPSKKVDITPPRQELLMSEQLENRVNEVIVNMAFDIPIEDSKQAIETIITNVFLSGYLRERPST